MNWLAFGSTLLVFVCIGLADGYALTQWPCKCRRSHFPYFLPLHAHPVHMLVRLLYHVMALMASVFVWHSLITTAVFAALSAWYFLIWWKHESGKIKRRAKRALGRVTFNHWGGLVVKA